MFAALPMYDPPAVRRHKDALWSAIRDRLRRAGIDAPEGLSRAPGLAAQWTSPDLLLGETCGLPFRTSLHERVTLLGAIDYGLEATPPGHYRSVFLAHRDDHRQRVSGFAGAWLAFNEAMSQSGWAAAAETGVPFRLLPATGSHQASARAVAEARADLAAVDAVTWRLLCQCSDIGQRLKVVGRSQPVPGLPLITAFSGLEVILRQSIREGIAGLATTNREALGIRGFVNIPLRAYLDLPIPPSPEAYAAANR